MEVVPRLPSEVGDRRTLETGSSRALFGEVPPPGRPGPKGSVRRWAVPVVRRGLDLRPFGRRKGSAAKNATGLLPFTMGVAVGDWNRDGLLDLHVTNMSSTAPRRARKKQVTLAYQFQYTENRLGIWTPQHAIVFRFWFGQRLSARGGR